MSRWRAQENTRVVSAYCLGRSKVGLCRSCIGLFPILVSRAVSNVLTDDDGHLRGGEPRGSAQQRGLGEAGCAAAGHHGQAGPAAEVRQGQESLAPGQR